MRIRLSATRIFAECADNAVVGQDPGQDTHIQGVGLVRTIDCNDSHAHGAGLVHHVYALGTCWAVTVQGYGNVVVADNVTNDVTVCGRDQTVLYKNGEPVVWDRGRELGMVNHIDRVAG